MRLVNPKIGGIIGRNDIVQGRGGPASANLFSGSVNTPDPTYGPTLGGNAGVGASGSFSIGQLSALQLMGLIGAWIAFYWWTHKHQG
jgi:hypothetical protein